MTTEMIIAWTTLLAAAMAAVLSFATLWKSGDRKIAEFRLRWIEKLREQIAALASIRAKCIGPVSEEHFPQIVLHLETITMMLNPKEEPHKDLKDAAAAIIAAKEIDGELYGQLRDAGSTVLRAEWKKIKRETRLLPFG